MTATVVFVRRRRLPSRREDNLRLADDPQRRLPPGDGHARPGVSTGCRTVVPRVIGSRSPALAAARREQQAIRNIPVFPAPRNPAESCSRHVMDAWLRTAHTLAKVDRRPRGMWHSLRREWASERKRYPVKDVACTRSVGASRPETAWSSTYPDCSITCRSLMIYSWPRSSWNPTALPPYRQSACHGAEGIRTLDPLVANQVLSQLSYRP